MGGWVGVNAIKKLKKIKNGEKIIILMDGWVEGCMGVKVMLRIAYSIKQLKKFF